MYALDLVARHARALDRRLHRGRAKVGRARVRQAALHTAHWRVGIGKKDDGIGGGHGKRLRWGKTVRESGSRNAAPAKEGAGVCRRRCRAVASDADCGRKQNLRSEEHTSELQSLMRISYAVYCLKKKTEQQLSAAVVISNRL